MAIKSLKDIYIDQLQDLYSANRQALEATRQLAEKAKDDGLKNALRAGVEGIEDGIDQISRLARSNGEEPEGEHCKGMEGLVAEARAHALEEDFSDDDARDAMIAAQYQRMAHYAIAGYGTLRAFAARLGNSDDADILQDCLDSAYEGDRTMTGLASGINRAAL